MKRKKLFLHVSFNRGFCREGRLLGVQVRVQFLVLTLSLVQSLAVA